MTITIDQKIRLLVPTESGNWNRLIGLLNGDPGVSEDDMLEALNLMIKGRDYANKLTRAERQTLAKYYDLVKSANPELGLP